MTHTHARGDGPIVFFTDKGTRLEVPLSAIYFDGTTVGTEVTPVPTGFNEWIAFLASRGSLVSSPVSRPAAALKVSAVTPGAFGNQIKVIVAPRAASGVVDVTATETNRYDDLTLASLTDRLGSSATGRGSEPGLLWVKDNPPAAAAAVPVASPATGIAPTPPTPPATLSSWTIASTGGATPDVVTLEPRTDSPAFDEPDFTVVAVSNVVAPAPGATTGPSFTLTVTWSRTVTDVSLANIAAKLADLGYLVAFTAPAGGFLLPRPGTYVLMGGAEPAPANPASTIILANE